MHNHWQSKETPTAIAQLGRAWAYLCAGCELRVHENEPNQDADFIFFSILHHDNHSIKHGIEANVWETFFLPTKKLLNKKHNSRKMAEHKDWNLK